MARTPFKLKSGNGTPFKQMGSSPVKENIIAKTMESFKNFLGSKQSDIAGKIGGEDVTNKRIGELRRESRHDQSFKNRMGAQKKLRDFYKNEPEVSGDPSGDPSDAKPYGYHTKKQAKGLHAFYTAPISETEKGVFPPVSERAVTYKDFGGTDVYTGSSKQNVWLLKQLQLGLD